MKTILTTLFLLCSSGLAAQEMPIYFNSNLGIAPLSKYAQIRLGMSFNRVRSVLSAQQEIEVKVENGLNVIYLKFECQAEKVGQDGCTAQSGTKIAFSFNRRNILVGLAIPFFIEGDVTNTDTVDNLVRVTSQFYKAAPDKYCYLPGDLTSTVWGWSGKMYTTELIRLSVNTVKYGLLLQFRTDGFRFDFDQPECN